MRAPSGGASDGATSVRSRRRSLAKPSMMCTLRCARCASSGSCVTIRMVVPLALICSSRSITLRAICRVEVAGRLVGQQHFRRTGQRAGDRHALLLAARQLGRVVRMREARPTIGQRVLDAFRALCRRETAVAQRHVDVVEDVRSGIRLKPWKMKPSFSLRRRERASSSRPLHADAVEHVVAAVEVLQQAGDVEEGGLAGARRPGDRDELAFRTAMSMPRSACVSIMWVR
jgi:hypothetical protein